MDPQEKLHLLNSEIAVLLAEHKELSARLEAIDRQLSPKLLKKRKLEEAVIEVQKIPLGRSGRQRKVKEIDVDSMSGAAAEALLKQLLAAVGQKGG